MNKSVVLLSRTIIVAAGLAVLSVLVILLPELAREEAVGKVNHPSALPYLIGAWILSVPVFFALHEAKKLVGYFEKDQAFSKASVLTLQNIKHSSIVFSTLIALGAVAVITIAKVIDPGEEVTPVVTIGFIFIFISSVITVFISILQRLLQDAITMKMEHDLTI